MENKNPIRWKIVLLMNLGMLGGCIVAAFTLPRTTRLSVFGVNCLVTVVTFNIALYFKGYRRSEAKLPGDSVKTTTPKNWWRILVFVFMWVYLIFEIFKNHVWR